VSNSAAFEAFPSALNFFPFIHLFIDASILYFENFLAVDENALLL
jgi:hypothetical protein